MHEGHTQDCQPVQNSILNYTVGERLLKVKWFVNIWSGSQHRNADHVAKVIFTTDNWLKILFSNFIDLCNVHMKMYYKKKNAYCKFLVCQSFLRCFMPQSHRDVFYHKFRARRALSLFILYCMAMRGIPEYIAQARTILHASVGQVQYGPSAGNIFWYPPNIKPCNIIIIIYKNRHIYFNYRGCGQILLSIDTVTKMYQCWFDEIFLTLQATCYGCDYYVTIDNVSWMWLLRHNRVRANALRSIVT